MSRIKGRALGRALGQASGALRLARPIAQHAPGRILGLGGCQYFCPPRAALLEGSGSHSALAFRTQPHDP